MQFFQKCCSSVPSWGTRAMLPSGSAKSGAKASVTLHWMKGRRSTKMGIRVRTMKSRKSHRASPPTFLRAISLTCRLSQYHWLSSWRSKQTRITFRATGEHTSAQGSQRCHQRPSQALGEGQGGHTEHKPTLACSACTCTCMPTHLRVTTVFSDSLQKWQGRSNQPASSKGLRIRTGSPISRETLLLHT